MAEETPSNLGANLFGGWVAGRAAGNRRLDASIDRLERVINRLADSMDRASGQFNRQARTGGGPSATQQSQSSMGNGGNPSFGGAHRDSGFGSTMRGMVLGGAAGAGGAHAYDEAGKRSSGQTDWSPFGSPGQRSNGGSFSFGGAGKVAAGAAVAAGAIYTANHYSNQMMGQSLAAQYAGGPNWSASYRAGLLNNYSAVNARDNMASAGMIAGQGGFVMGSQGYQGARASISAMSYANPQISNVQMAQANLGLAGVGTYNRLQGLGMNPMGANGHMGDARSMARQILDRIPGIQRVKTQQQVAAMFAPSGGATVTVNGMVANGFIPANSANAILGEMRNIMQARVSGMSFSAYSKLTTAASTMAPSSNPLRFLPGLGGHFRNQGDEARDALRQAGLGNTLVNRQRTSEGMSRDTEGKTIEGFAAGVSAATDALQQFRGVLNAILGIPGVGWLAGAGSGATGTMPIIGSLLGKIPGGGMAKGLLSGLGGNAPTMSRGGGGDGFSGSGGHGPGRQSRSVSASAPAGSGGGMSLMAPRPGINHMSSEQDFGPRTIGQGYHTGVDLEGRTGDPVKAAAAGVVTNAGWGASGDAGYGNVIVVNHGNGWKTMYAHLSAITKGKGKRVRAGEVIGRVGDTGSYARGSHLHFELWHNGKPVNPEPYIRGKRINATGGGGSSAGTSNSMGSGVGNLGTIDGLGDPGTGTVGQTLGQTGSFNNAGSGSVGGLYSEVAALGLGSSGGLAGGAMGAGSGSLPQAAAADGSAGSLPGGGFGPGGPGNAKVATFNTHTSSVSAAHAERDLAKIMASGVGSMSLQEFYYKHKAAPIPGWLAKQGWGIHKGPTGTSVAWDKSRYNASNFGDYDLNVKYSMPKTISQRFASYALLTDKQTGARFWQVSAHLIPNTPRAPVSKSTRDAMWREQVQRLNALQQRLGHSAPVVIGLDANDRSNRIFSGMNSDGLSGIDSIFGTKGSTRQNGAHFLQGLYSDHNALIGNLTLGHAAGTGTAGNKSHGGTGGLHGNKATVNGVAAGYGWGSGREWSALVNLVNSESGFRNTAQNPTSTAYGMFQFLNSTWGGYKYGKTSDPYKQAVDGLQYIKRRYGDPIKAWNFHKSHNWYEVGEWNIRADQDARVHKGEMILPTKVAEEVRNALTAPGSNRIAGRGGAHITFQAGAISVSLGGGGNITRQQATVAGQQIVDAMLEDRRMSALMAG